MYPSPFTIGHFAPEERSVADLVDGATQSGVLNSRKLASWFWRGLQPWAVMGKGM